MNFKGRNAKELAAYKESHLETRNIDYDIEIKQQVSWSL